VAVAGPSLVLLPEQAQLVAMAVHELATNAAKYGSLSVGAGKVDVSWSDRDGTLFLDWSETGGPRVVPPAKLGFGTKIISSLGGGRRGRTHFSWRPTGLNFELELRYEESVQRSNGAAHDAQVVHRHGESRLLLVEDELVVGLFMQDLLKAIGYRPTDPIGRLARSFIRWRSY
jgi:hypothetical protein